MQETNDNDLRDIMLEALHLRFGITDEAALEAWLRESPHHRQLYNTLMDTDLVRERLQHMAGSQERMDRGLASIHRRMLEEEMAAAIPHIDNKKSTWRRYAPYAAAAIVLITGGVWLYTGSSAHTDNTRASWPQPVSNAFSDIQLIDHNHPLLILPGNELVGLDTLPLHQTIQYKYASLQKTDNRKVVYYASGRLGAPSASERNSFLTPGACTYTIVLPDTSEVTLDALSRLHFPTAFTGKERNIAFSGRALFDIAKNTAMPLRVSLRDNIDVKVWGTHFVIKAWENDTIINTTLIEGSVSISRASGGSLPDSALLRPREQASWHTGSSQLQVAKADMKEVLAWENGMFTWENAPVKNILDDLARWYNIKTDYTPEIGQIKITSTVPRSKSLRDICEVLQTTTPEIEFLIRNNKLSAKLK